MTKVTLTKRKTQKQNKTHTKPKARLSQNTITSLAKAIFKKGPFLVI